MKNIIIAMILSISIIVSGCIPLLVGGFIGYEISEEQRYQERMAREQRILDELRIYNEHERWRYYNKRKLTHPDNKHPER